jgi:hypothetical protein
MVPSGFNEPLINLEHLAIFADRSHLTSSMLREKYTSNKTTSSATQTDTIATVTERDYALLQVTVDRLGRLGYTVQGFLGLLDTFFPASKP